VLSLASQQEALAKSFGGNSDIEIVGVYEEAKSAKTPGRPLFAEMLKRIEAGEADGIASWAPDRLARNSIDGGHIIYLLDRGILRDLKFATYTFENNSQGKFMLGIMFNQSKYYSDALSENVKRGNATKVAMGWRPNMAPLGYLNCPSTRTIIPDPDLFPIVRRIFELAMTGQHTPHDIARIARDEWGVLTPKRGRSGGKPLARSSIYRMLSNPFYMGTLEWAGSSQRGRHKPVVSAREFADVQARLRHRAFPRPSRHTFAYSGFLSCGRCGRAISAEHKINRHGSHYTYYHCAARSRISNACAERSVEEASLTKQFIEFLASLKLRATTVAWVREQLRAQRRHAKEAVEKIAAARSAARAEIATQLVELTSLRLRRLVDDDEFIRERQKLETTRRSLQKAPDPQSDEKVFELLDAVERISNQAAKWFATAPPEFKQKILKQVCSNPTLIDRKLSIQAAKPFVIRSDLDGSPNLRGVVDEVRTFTGEGEQLLSVFQQIAAAGEVDDLLEQLNALQGLLLPMRPPSAGKKRSDAGERRRVEDLLSNPVPRAPNRSKNRPSSP